jgi:hypothetical protein
LIYCETSYKFTWCAISVLLTAPLNTSQFKVFPGLYPLMGEF